MNKIRKEDSPKFSSLLFVFCALMLILNLLFSFDVFCQSTSGWTFYGEKYRNSQSFRITTHKIIQLSPIRLSKASPSFPQEGDLVQCIIHSQEIRKGAPGSSANWKRQLGTISKGNKAIVIDVYQFEDTRNRKEVWIKIQPYEPQERPAPTNEQNNFTNPELHSGWTFFAQKYKRSNYFRFQTHEVIQLADSTKNRSKSFPYVGDQIRCLIASQEIRQGPPGSSKNWFDKTGKILQNNIVTVTDVYQYKDRDDHIEVWVKIDPSSKQTTVTKLESISSNVIVPEATIDSTKQLSDKITQPVFKEALIEKESHFVDIINVNKREKASLKITCKDSLFKKLKKENPLAESYIIDAILTSTDFNIFSPIKDPQRINKTGNRWQWQITPKIPPYKRGYYQLLLNTVVISKYNNGDKIYNFQEAEEITILVEASIWNIISSFVIDYIELFAAIAAIISTIPILIKKRKKRHQVPLEKELVE